MLDFSIEVDAESLSGVLSYTDPNYDFLGNSINYSLSSTNNDKPNQGYENSIVSAEIIIVLPLNSAMALFALRIDNFLLYLNFSALILLPLFIKLATPLVAVIIFPSSERVICFVLKVNSLANRTLAKLKNTNTHKEYFINLFFINSD